MARTVAVTVNGKRYLASGPHNGQNGRFWDYRIERDGRPFGRTRFVSEGATTVTVGAAIMAAAIRACAIREQSRVVRAPDPDMPPALAGEIGTVVALEFDGDVCLSVMVMWDADAETGKAYWYPAHRLQAAL